MSSLSKEQQNSIRKGIPVSCPQCNEILKIEEKSLDDGAKCKTYACVNQGCHKTSGHVVIHWYHILLYALSQKLVALSILFIVGLSGVATTFINDLFKQEDDLNKGVLISLSEFQEWDCDADKKGDYQIEKKKLIACLNQKLEELHDYRKDVEWAKTQKSSTFLGAYLSARAKSLENFSKSDEINKETKIGNSMLTILAINKGRERGMWDGNIMLESYCSSVNCEESVNDLPRGAN